jgi:hypothetical protein
VDLADRRFVDRLMPMLDLFGLGSLKEEGRVKNTLQGFLATRLYVSSARDEEENMAT